MRTTPYVPLNGTPIESRTEAATRVADVLLLFTQGPGSLGVSEIGRELGLSKAVVHRILQSLASRQIVEPDPSGHGYRLGRSAVALGARALRDLDLRQAAKDVLRRMRDETQETTTLSELVGTSRVYLDQFEGPQELKVSLELGRPHPLHAGATGKAMLAFLPTPTIDQILHGHLKQVTPATIDDPEALRAELALIRQRGVAISVGERKRGVGSIAAPIFDAHHDVVGAISTCGPIQRFDPQTVEHHTPTVRHAAHEISTNLGWTPQ